MKNPCCAALIIVITAYVTLINDVSVSDFNFERINLDSPCVPVRGYNPYIIPSDCPEETYYNVSSG